MSGTVSGTVSFLTLLAFVAVRITDTVQTLCDQYSQLPSASGQYTFKSNQWGDDGSGHQCIQISDNGIFTARWKWSDNPTQVHSYPNVGLNQSILPVELSDLNSLTLSIKWSMKPAPNNNEGDSPNPSVDPNAPVPSLDAVGLKRIKAKANVALDMFLDVDPERSKSTTAAASEVMIWIGTIGGAVPFRADESTGKPHTYNLKNTDFALSTSINQSKQTVFTWLANTNLTSITPAIDFSPLLRYLVKQNLLPSSTYLGVLQVGSETYHANDMVSFQVASKGFGLNVTAREAAENKTEEENTKESAAARFGCRAGLGAVMVGLIPFGAVCVI